MDELLRRCSCDAESLAKRHGEIGLPKAWKCSFGHGDLKTFLQALQGGHTSAGGQGGGWDSSYCGAAAEFLHSQARAQVKHKYRWQRRTLFIKCSDDDLCPGDIGELKVSTSTVAALFL